jgi:hypothetical protein
MSRLRRPVLSEHWSSFTCRLLPRRGLLTASEFACFGGVIHERREKHGFLLSAWDPRTRILKSAKGFEP